MKVIITGGCGFIGSHLADSLIELNYEVIVVDNLSVGRLENISHLSDNSKFTFLKADISNLLRYSISDAYRPPFRSTVMNLIIQSVFKSSCMGLKTYGQIVTVL